MLLIKIPTFFQVCRPTSMNTVSQLQKTCENKYLQLDENCDVTGRPGSKFFSGPLLCCLWWNLDTCVVFGTISVFTFV